MDVSVRSFEFEFEFEFGMVIGGNEGNVPLLLHTRELREFGSELGLERERELRGRY